MRFVLFVLSLLLLIGIEACGGNASAPTNAPAPTIAVAATGAPAPTNAPATTNVSAPTNAPAPATGAEPTQAAAPTNAPAPTTVAEPTQAPAPTNATAGGDLKPPEGAPSDIVKKSLLSVFTANSVRAKTVLMPAQGEPQTLLLEYEKPDRMRIVQPDGTEQIAIKGKGMWRKVDDKWQAESAQMADMLFGFVETPALEESLKTIQIDSVQFAGADLIDAKPMFVYTYKTLVDVGSTKSSGTGKVWIGALDGRPYKGDSESESAVVKGKFDRTEVTYEYDVPLGIQAPQ